MAVDKRHPVPGDGLTVADVWPSMVVELLVAWDPDVRRVEVSPVRVLLVERLSRDLYRLTGPQNATWTMEANTPVQLVGWFVIPIELR